MCCAKMHPTFHPLFLSENIDFTFHSNWFSCFPAIGLIVDFVELLDFPLVGQREDKSKHSYTMPGRTL